MRIADTIMALALLGLSLAFMWKAGERPEWTEEARFSNIGIGVNGAMKGGFWPFWVGVIMGLCSIWVFVNALMRRTAVSQSNEPYLDLYGVQILLTIALPVFLMVATTEYISMYFAIALFVFYYLAIVGRHGLLFALVFALVLPFWLYLFFDIVMTKTLPKGILAIEDTIYTPAGNYFRKLGAEYIAGLFVATGALIVAGRWVQSRMPGAANAVFWVLAVALPAALAIVLFDGNGGA